MDLLKDLIKCLHVVLELLPLGGNLVHDDELLLEMELISLIQDLIEFVWPLMHLSKESQTLSLVSVNIIIDLVDLPVFEHISIVSLHGQEDTTLVQEGK